MSPDELMCSTGPISGVSHPDKNQVTFNTLSFTFSHIFVFVDQIANLIVIHLCFPVCMKVRVGPSSVQKEEVKT